MQELDSVDEEEIQRLFAGVRPLEDSGAARRVELVLRRCGEQIYGRDTVTLLLARLWVALATLIVRFLDLSRGRAAGRIATHFAAAPPG
ncbi:MAG: hypothetical protein ACRETY_01245 [Steroidobacteraceae bacterium]